MGGKNKIVFLIAILLCVLYINSGTAQIYVNPNVEEALKNQSEVFVFIKMNINEAEWNSKTLDERKNESDYLQDKIVPFLEYAGVKKIHKFDSSPFLSGYINKDSLDKLRSNEDIESIELVGYASIALSGENDVNTPYLYIFLILISLLILFLVLYLLKKYKKTGGKLDKKKK